MDIQYGAIEFGGTKTICAIGSAAGKLANREVIPTTTVEETFEKIYHFFGSHDPVATLGVGAFGPLDLDINSQSYGAMKNTPKPGWGNVDVKNMLESRLRVPVVIDQDVNCAARGELHHGAGKGIDNFVYMTLGTGIGGSLVINKVPFRSLFNSEMGHMFVLHELFTGDFLGACPFHGDCLEGIASGSAMEQRFGQKAEHITDQDAWNKETGYISSAIHNIMMTVSPEKIILGGGIVKHHHFIEAVRMAVAKQNNNYLPFPDLENYIVQSIGDDNGVLGALILASEKQHKSQV